MAKGSGCTTALAPPVQPCTRRPQEEGPDSACTFSRCGALRARADLAAGKGLVGGLSGGALGLQQGARREVLTVQSRNQPGGQGPWSLGRRGVSRAA